MITSFSRLFRQIFGGSRAQPVTEALSRDIGAESEAREAAEHRESLKRAMEAAFATPTASAEEPVETAPQTVVELQAAAEEAATAIAAREAEPAAEELELEVVADPAAEEPIEIVAEVPVAEPVATELPPAIDLAEVEESTEHDIEVIEWDIARLAREPAGPATPIVEDQVAIAHQTGTEIEVEIDATEVVAAETEERAAPIAANAADEIVSEQSAAGDALEPAPELTDEFIAAATKPKRTKKSKAPAKKKSSTAKKKTAAKKTAALPEDAVWLSDAIAFSLKGEWSSVWTPPEDASGAERLETFREKAAAGELVIWARPEGGESWEPVKAAYWKTALVEPLSFLMGRDNVVSDPKASKAKKPVKYTALKVAQAEIEALWPPASPEGVRDAA